MNCTFEQYLIGFELNYNKVCDIVRISKIKNFEFLFEFTFLF
jgi:hypothetical protein